ncbi:MAG: hypothetical protein OXG44_15805 [Gammaproteobacteria bacterium]|nr:hypothetical protein [Gammaproteobacteria bacterium]
MTSGKTSIKFTHDPVSAVEAAISAVALALTWTPDGSDRKPELERARDELQMIRKRMKSVTTAKPGG